MGLRINTPARYGGRMRQDSIPAPNRAFHASRSALAPLYWPRPIPSRNPQPCRLADWLKNSPRFTWGANTCMNGKPEGPAGPNANASAEGGDRRFRILPATA